MSDLVEVTRFLDATEAQVALGFLRSQGLDASLGEGTAGAQINPLPLLGGLRLLVPATQLAAARALLDNSDSRRPRCPACGSAALLREEGESRIGTLAMLARLFSGGQVEAPADVRCCAACGQRASLDELLFDDVEGEGPWGAREPGRGARRDSV